MARVHPYVVKREVKASAPHKVFAACPDHPMVKDLRPGMLPIENQSTLGACTGHAIVGALEYLEVKQGKPAVRLSRLFVYFNERMVEGTINEDAGANIGDGINVVAKYGACDENLWPYHIRHYKEQPNDAAYADGLKRRAITHYAVQQTEDALISALANDLPIVFGIVVYDSFESDEVARTGLVPMPNTQTETCQGGHAVLICGYDRNRRLFLVRNSWGEDWGDGGYFWLPFDFVLNPNLADSFYVVEAIS